MGQIFTPETIGAQAAERKLKSGDRLWVAGDKVDNGAYRQGNSPSNPAVHLRWRDLDVPKIGKIEDADLTKAVIRPGQGLSLFIEKIVHADFNHIGSQDAQCSKAALAALAKEKGYTEASQIRWFRMDSGKVMPVGLEVVFDNDPPGHCTLTVTREMTAHEFLGLVSEHLGFSYIGTDIWQELRITMATKKIALSDKQMTYIILALDAYVKVLQEDEDDPGPSMADSLYVAELAKSLREGKLSID